MTNKDWLLSLDDKKMANVIIGVAQGAQFYSDPIGYICKWLADTREDWRTKVSRKEMRAK